MRIDIWKCDKCGDESRDAVDRIRFEIGSQIDGAGDRDDVCQYADLCPLCAKLLISTLLGQLTDKTREALARIWGAS